jgi:hypothetical protein
MIGLLWNIRGMGKIGRVPVLSSRIKDNHADWVGVIETKKRVLPWGFSNPSLAVEPFLGVIFLLEALPEES